ncbi:hypothetical protein M9434_005126 [Picochlorum sp. BPE23]|nr:hypothetical protein M9434_005126 [Picochlorum sp. BPE23]
MEGSRPYTSGISRGCERFYISNPSCRRTTQRLLLQVQQKSPVRTHVGVGEVAVLAGISYGIIGASVVPLFVESTGQVPADGEEDEVGNVRWSVMAVLSCFPYLNYMGWVFAALDDEENAQMYWVFACLYAAPYVVDGLRLDGFTVVCLILCVIHTQIERIGKTEAGFVRRQLQDAGIKLLPQQQQEEKKKKKKGAWLSSLLESRTTDESDDDDDAVLRIQTELDAFDRKLNELENENSNSK